MKYRTVQLRMELPKEAVLFDCDSLYGRLQELEDRRDCRGRLYELSTLLFVTILAKLMGQNQIGAIAHWAKLRQVELSQLLGLKRQTMPHKTTWGRVLAAGVVVEEFAELVADFFGELLPAQIPARGSVVLRIDGKTLRGTIPQGKTQGVHLMAAYLPTVGVVLAQVALEHKENEIVAAPKLLRQLDLRGLVVTGDAMQTQRQLSVEIVAGGGDYLWFCKENQKDLLADVQILFEPEPVAPGCSPNPTDFRSATEFTKAHGRIEKRVLTASSWLKDYTPFPHLEQAFKLEKTVWDSTGQKLYHEVRFGISSLPKELASPRRLLAIAKADWTIENGLHWRRDVLLAEDHSRLTRGVAPQVNAICNNLVLGLLAANGYRDVAAARREFDYNPNLALDLLTNSILSIT